MRCLTAAYMTRAIYKTFYGEYRGQGTPHESPADHDVAALDPERRRDRARLPEPAQDFQIDGVAEYATRFEHFVEPTFAFPEIEHPEFSLVLAVVSTAGGRRSASSSPISTTGARRSPLKGLSKQSAASRSATTRSRTSTGSTSSTPTTSSGASRARSPGRRTGSTRTSSTASSTRSAWCPACRAGVVYRDVDQRVVDGIVIGSGSASEESGQFLRHIQTGKVQQYAAILFAAAAILAGMFVFIV